MSENQVLQDNLANWTAWLRRHKLVGGALLALQLIDMWSFVGEQMIWALMPFLNQSTRTTLTELANNPESLDHLRLLLAEGDD